MMKLLPRLLVGGCFLLCLCGTSLADDNEFNNSSDEKLIPSINNNLNSEQMHYVLLECEGFAVEDNISLEDRPAYIETCVEELSAAVIKAIKQLQAKPESAVISTNDDGLIEN